MDHTPGAANGFSFSPEFRACQKSIRMDQTGWQCENYVLNSGFLGPLLMVSPACAMVWSLILQENDLPGQTLLHERVDRWILAWFCKSKT
jgi:hypothetical protein